MSFYSSIKRWCKVVLCCLNNEDEDICLLGSTLLIEVIGAWKKFFAKSDTIAKSAPRFTIVTQDQINLNKHSEI